MDFKYDTQYHQAAYISNLGQKCSSFLKNLGK